MNTTKIIFLDWNKTLSYSLFWGHLSDPKHLNNAIEKPIIDWLFNKNRPIINQWMRGKYSAEDICKNIAQDTGLDYNLIFEELKYSCQTMEFCDPAIPDIISNLRSKGYKVVIATDNMDTFKKFTIPEMKLENMFDDFLISSEMGILKEDYINDKAAFFEPYMVRNNFEYENTVLFDDCADKMDICKKIGMRTVNITSPTQLVDELKKLDC
jgi:FMN phosphatase YigB (HAD superfamily)